MDTGSMIALATLALAAIAAIVTVVLRFGKVEAAAETARQAHAIASATAVDLGEFRERVARDYATSATVNGVETRVIGAIDRLGDRMDRILEGRSTTARPRPPAK